MSLFSRLLQAVRSWRPRRRPQAIRRAGVAMEQLDHRQLLSVNFTGNVPVDFPASQSPGVVVLPDNPTNTHPAIPPLLQPIVGVSGFQIQDIRVSYDSTNDTLYFGLNGPPSGNSGQGEVIAGDADNNGNSGTVNPAIPALEYPPLSGNHPYASYQDFPDFSGSEYMGTFLDFNGNGTPQIVAGYSSTNPIPGTPSNPDPPKPYEVAVANPGNLSNFGTWLTQFTGNVYSQNSAAHPNLEFAVSHFSQLYQLETGKPLTSSSVIYVGGQGGSANDFTGEEFFNEQAVNIGAATLPVAPTPTPCPPQSPSILINPHEHRIIDSLHRDLVRVTVMGTSGFKVSDINPATVTLDGAHAIAHVPRKVRRDPFPMDTYVFVANQLHLHKGLNNVTLSGTLKNGVTKFSTSNAVLNIPYASKVARGPLQRYMGNHSVYKSLSKVEAKHPIVAINSTTAQAVTHSPSQHPNKTAGLAVSYTPVVQTATKRTEAARPHAHAAPRPVVTIRKTRETRKQTVSKLPTVLRHSMNDFFHQHQHQHHQRSVSNPTATKKAAARITTGGAF